jgi:hypothetical protein
VDAENTERFLNRYVRLSGARAEETRPLIHTRARALAVRERQAQHHAARSTSSLKTCSSLPCGARRARRRGDRVDPIAQVRATCARRSYLWCSQGLRSAFLL